MALLKKSKIESAIEDFHEELRRLNKLIDEDNAEIRAYEAQPNHSQAEIQTEALALIHNRAERFRKTAKFELGNRNLNLLDLCPVYPCDNRGRPIGGPPNIQLLVDAFYFLLEGSPAALANIRALAPAGGDSNEKNKKNKAAKLEKKLAHETELEALYQEMEQAGFIPSRRVDLSARVLLNFVDNKNWSRQKLESIRQRCGELREAQAKLSGKRSDVIQARLKLEHLADGQGDQNSQLKDDIQALKNEENRIDARIPQINLEMKNNQRILQSCFDFLRAENISVDHHV